MKAKELKKQKPGVGFPIHPLAQAMPEMPEREYRPFKKDIRDHGQMEPIKVLNGMVIDGRHRQRACLELGIEPWYVFLKEGTDPLQYILSNNPVPPPRYQEPDGHCCGKGLHDLPRVVVEWETGCEDSWF